MNRKINSILNISAYPGLYSHVYKGYITTDMPTIKIYNQKEKKYTLDFLIKLFIFSFLIWVLQCSNNWYSFRSWNYKNNSKNILNLGANRLLAEKIYKVGQGKEELKLCEQQCKVETELEQRNGQREVEEHIDVEQESEIEAKQANKKVKYNEKILERYNISKICSLYFASILSFTSLLLSIIYTYSPDLEFQRLSFLYIDLSVILFSVLLILEEIKIKHRVKL
ncbi:fam-h protein [Plasmodium relictum]|uniref:Fam-h protein n=1 Tax=Plasmodium relictum TaxID=85471 RepID=A0A1J1GKU7_PLARL|nr:fam-h protein [Plasmodium relictum]CRG85694.1 fam-h protein [Plasmodium relictum]